MRPAEQLRLTPRLCDGCGACVTVCAPEAIRIGRTYIKVDHARCDGCGACAKACTRQAITAAEGLKRAAPAPRPRDRSHPPRTQGDRAAPVKRAKGPTCAFEWSLLDAGAMLSVTFSAFIVKEAFAYLADFDVMSAGVAVWARAGVLVCYYAAQLAVLVWLVRRRGGRVFAALGMSGPEARVKRPVATAGIALLALLAARAVTGAYAYATREIGLMPTSAGFELQGIFGSGVPGIVLAIALVVIVAPVVEEMVFRGALQRGLTVRFGTWPAIAMQAGLFAVFHRSVWLIVPMAVLGMVLGWLARRCGSLWPAIGAHAAYNGLTVAAAIMVSG